MFRLYIDEVGNDDLTHTHKDSERYLSLTGVAMRLDHARRALAPNMDWIKTTVFEPEFDDGPVILHRTDILGKKGPFQILGHPDKADLFDRAMLRLIRSHDYAVITALIDKQWMLRQRHWRNPHPYHYLMEILVEKYVRFLEREGSIGDIMPESRGSTTDARLQRAYSETRANGTPYVTTAAIAKALPSAALKFRHKRANIAGLQLCDLLAHPSHMNLRHRMKHAVILGPFASKIAPILESEKYDRNPATGRVLGYGIKYLPQ